MPITRSQLPQVLKGSHHQVGESCLMSIEKLDDGRWFLDIEPVKGKRYRRKFKTKSEALQFENSIKSKVLTGDTWKKPDVDKRPLSALIELWYGHHGIHLADPERRKRSLVALCIALGNLIAKNLTPTLYLNYRKVRAQDGVSGKTLNNELGYLNALYAYLWQTEQITYQSPLRKVKPIRIKERELSYLTTEQCEELLGIAEQAKNPCLHLIIRVCLQTGARWSEAEKLTHSQIGQARLTFTDTKSGKIRTVPITPKLEQDLRNHSTGQLKLFSTSIDAFRRLLEKCSFRLPRGQAAHALRHSYASHFMMNGEDILTLQRILGHSSINLTMRYAHLSPDHLLDAVKFRPAIED